MNENEQTYSCNSGNSNITLEDIEDAKRMIEEYAKRIDKKYFVMRVADKGLEIREISEYCGKILWGEIKINPFCDIELQEKLD